MSYHLVAANRRPDLQRIGLPSQYNNDKYVSGNTINIIISIIMMNMTANRPPLPPPPAPAPDQVFRG